MGDNHPEYEYGDPCPNCGEDEWFGETAAAHGTVYFDGNAKIEDFQMQEIGEPLIVECFECDTILIDKIS